MKFVTTFTCLMIIVGCTQSTPKNKKDRIKTPLTNNADTTIGFALQQLYARIQANGNSETSLDIRNNEITLHDTLIRLKTKVEFNGQKQGKWVYATNFKTEYNAGRQQELTMGAIGMGTTSREAFEVCIKEWMAIFGEPFANMLGQKNALAIAGYKVYPGLMGIRGAVPPNTWLKGDRAMTQKIITQIRPLLLTNKNALIPVDIKVLLGPAGIEDGECRIDNFVSYELLKALQKLPWPVTNDKLIFSQFYLVQK
jgi:hypothetical protein